MYSWSSLLCYTVAGNAFRPEPRGGSRPYAGPGVQLCPYRRRTRDQETTLFAVSVRPGLRRGWSRRSDFLLGQAFDALLPDLPPPRNTDEGRLPMRQAVRNPRKQMWAMINRTRISTGRAILPPGAQFETTPAPSRSKSMTESVDSTAVASPGPWQAAPHSRPTVGRPRRARRSPGGQLGAAGRADRLGFSPRGVPERFPPHWMRRGPGTPRPPSRA
jgi:hypothetical protein